MAVDTMVPTPFTGLVKNSIFRSAGKSKNRVVQPDMETYFRQSEHQLCWPDSFDGQRPQLWRNALWEGYQRNQGSGALQRNTEIEKQWMDKHVVKYVYACVNTKNTVESL